VIQGWVWGWVAIGLENSIANGKKLRLEMGVMTIFSRVFSKRVWGCL
jgi:predicted phage tail protein